MKKLIGLFSLILLFAIGASATNSKPNNNAHSNNNGVEQQKQDKTKNQKKEKYDFSLFKFITPSKSENKQDTLLPSNESLKHKNKFNGETTILYEKPRDFLMFS